MFFQSLKEEIRQQEDLLKELEQVSQDYKVQGNIDGYERLENQTNLLNVRFYFFLPILQGFQQSVRFTYLGFFRVSKSC